MHEIKKLKYKLKKENSSKVSHRLAKINLKICYAYKGYCNLISTKVKHEKDIDKLTLIKERRLTRTQLLMDTIKISKCNDNPLELWETYNTIKFIEEVVTFTIKFKVQFEKNLKIIDQM